MSQHTSNDIIAMMAAIFDSEDKKDLLTQLKKTVQQVGFETFMVGLEMRGEDGRVAHHIWSDYPQKWQETYLQQRYERIDPTVPHCQKTTNPIIWNEQFFQSAKADFMLEEARSYGLHHGISLAVHTRFGTKTMMSFVRDKSLTASPEESRQLQNYSQLISACTHQVAHQLLETDIKGPTLTKRERECLQWIAIGKPTPEIADIMNVSDSTVAFHVKNILRKLDVHTRPQALAKAMRMGLVG